MHRGLFENAAFGIFQTTRDGRFIRANKALARIFGYDSAEELLGSVQDIGRQIHVDPARREEFAALMEEQGVVTNFEARAYKKDGSIIWIALTGRVVPETGGAPSCFEGIAEDVTQRRQALQRLAAQYAVTSIIAQATDVSEAASQVLSAICESLDWDVGAFWQLDESQSVLRCLDVWSRDSRRFRPFTKATREFAFARGEGLPGRIWKSGKPGWIKDVTKDNNFPRAPAAAAAGLTSALAFPILLGKRVTGVLEVFDSNPRSPDKDTQEALSSLGSQLGQLIERRRNEQAVRRRERQQAAVSDLGSRALKGLPVQELMDGAAQLLAEEVGVELVKVLELLPDGESLRLRAGLGWRRGLVGKAQVPAGKHSQAGYALASRHPVIVRDLRTEKRFRGAQLLLDHGVVSGMSVIIQGTARPFGVLGVHCRRRRVFTEDDINFLQAIANIVAAAIERSRWEEALRESEAKTGAVVSSAVDSIITIDERGVIQSFNPAASRMFGYSPAETIGKRVNMLMPLPESREHDSYIKHYLRTGEKRIIGIGREVLARRKDGATFPVELAISELQLSGRRLFTGILRDISERKQTERETQQLVARVQLQRQRTEDLVSRVPGVVWEAWGKPDEASQRMDFVSRHVEAMLGYSVEEWTSTPNFWLQIVHPDDRERAAAEAAAIFAGERRGVSEFRWLGKDGRVRWVEAQSTVIHDAAGNPLGMRGVTMDITERKLREDRGRFLSDASEILASSLDYETSLQDVARLVVDRLADVCSVDMVEGDTVRRLALALNDPEAEGAFLGMGAAYTPADPDAHPVYRVVLTNQPFLLEEVPPEMLEAAARDAEHLALLRALDIRSLIIVPLVVAGEALGALTLVSTRPERQYTEEDLAFAAELARRAAMAIDHSRRYETEQAARRDAERAADRIARIQAVTAALSEAPTATQVGDVVVDAAIASVNAHSGLVALIEDGGEHLELVSARRVGKHFEREWESFAEQPPPAILQALNAGRALFIETGEELVAVYPELGRLVGPDQRAFICVPLMIEGRAVGGMVLTFAALSGVSEDDRNFIMALCRQCSQALERARLYEGERAARHRAEEAADRTARLQSLTAALSRALTPGQVAQMVLRHGLKALGAKAGAIVLLVGDGSELEVIAQSGYPKKLVRRGQRFPLAADISLTRAIHQRRVIVMRSLAERQSGNPLLAAVESLGGPGAAAAVPLQIGDRVLGAMAVNFSQDRDFNEEDEQLLVTMARLCAQALERARLFEAEKAARAEAERAGRDQAFLAEASALLASSLDYETTLASVARLAVPTLGDWCSIDIVEEGGGLRRVTVVHSDPAKLQFAKQLEEKYPPAADGGRAMAHILATGEPAFYPEISDEMLAGSAIDDEHLRLMRELGLKSALAVPLVARGKSLGVLTLVTAESGRRYSEEDLGLAQDLARRAGLAVDNARLYRESQRTQEELRRANEAKDEFLGMVSHELRTPITTIYGGSRLLSSHGDRLDAESRGEILRDIEQESERLHRIVEDLLVLARVELGQEVLSEPVLAQRVIEKAMLALAKQRPARRVSVDVEKGLPPISASPGYLEQILRNLLNNADKYTPVEEPVDVQACRLNEAEAVISVLDRGPGIPEADAERIFERFFRSDATAKQAGGAGIGLTVCRRLVEAQGGRIWARQREGGGLEVSFSLPFYLDGA